MPLSRTQQLGKGHGFGTDGNAEQLGRGGDGAGSDAAKTARGSIATGAATRAEDVGTGGMV